jgi:spermidine synthase
MRRLMNFSQLHQQQTTGVAVIQNLQPSWLEKEESVDLSQTTDQTFETAAFVQANQPEFPSLFAYTFHPQIWHISWSPPPPVPEEN